MVRRQDMMCVIQKVGQKYDFGKKIINNIRRISTRGSVRLANLKDHKSSRCHPCRRNSQMEEFGERKVVLHLMVPLHSHQAAKVRINQILNALMSKTEDFCSHAMSEDANNCFI